MSLSAHTLKRARECLREGNIADAQLLSKRVLARAPRDPDALCVLGVSHLISGSARDAVPLFEQALSVAPRHCVALEHLGVALLLLDRYPEAEHALRRAATVPGAPASVMMRLGIALLRLERHGDAIEALTRALELSPDNVDSHLNLGQALAHSGDIAGARAHFETILQLLPGHADAMFNLGVLSLDRDELQDARLWFDRVIAESPGHSEAYVNLGIVLQRQGDLAGAVTTFQHAIALNGSLPAAHFNLGQAFNDEGRMDEAAECYRNTLSLQPEHVEARWALTVSQIPAVYENDDEPARRRAAFSQTLQELEEWFDPSRIAQGYRAVGAVQPFLLAYQEENNRDLLSRYGKLCTKLMSHWFNQTGFASPGKNAPGDGVRVGIVSQYFWKHSVWDALLKGWLQHLDRTQFSVHAFYVGTKQDDETVFAKDHVSFFRQGPLDLRGWVEVILDQHLDVIIYPEVGMDPLTAQLASLRLAPVQVAAWGHPETTGLPTIDYYLSAEGLEPPDAHENYIEQLVRLPHLGCFYESSPVQRQTPDLLSWGIEPNTPLLICPGVPFKYAPRHDRVLVDIALELGHCRFILFKHRLSNLSEKLHQRLAVAFAQKHLNLEDFVTFVPWQDTAGFQGLLERADVFLDTIGFSGFNTAMQAVECGIPIVTREGPFMRGRLAAGILKRLDLPALIAQSEDDYISIAVNLAHDATYRMHLRKHIEQTRHILFEDLAPIRAMETFLKHVTLSQ
ncbi:MAG: tetratricopeptide repeat protein [Burkholderiales bacterium]